MPSDPLTTLYALAAPVLALPRAINPAWHDAAGALVDACESGNTLLVLSAAGKLAKVAPPCVARQIEGQIEAMRVGARLRRAA